MSKLVETLRRHAEIRPHACAVTDGEVNVSYARLVNEIGLLARRLDVRCVGLLMDNGPAWVVADLATLARGLTCVPLPPYFSTGQLRHVIEDAGVELVVTDQPGNLEGFAAVESVLSTTVCGTTLALCRLRGGRPAAQGGPAKISYTSGTTGAPRGVCLSLAVIEGKAETLARVTAAGPDELSLCLAPLAILLENIGSVYVPLLVGARCCVPPLRLVGMQGSSGLDAARLAEAVSSYRPTSFISTPQVLRVLVQAGERGRVSPGRLRFVAVGGAPVSPELQMRAAHVGLPVYQGYGLTEAASVVALNTPGAARRGSVGRALPGLSVGIAPDGEIRVDGPLFDGYLGEPRREPGASLYTGDLGSIDEDGYVYVNGRKKNMFTTAFGRNVSPEWVESELCAQGAVAQALVVGEGRAVNVAIVVPAAGSTPEDIAGAVGAANSRLPDYARIGDYVLAREPFTRVNGQLTGTGRPRRDVITGHYADAIAATEGRPADGIL